MPVDVAIPEMGESVSEVILLRWIKAEEEFVERDEPLCELETDKANVDLPAPVAGILHPTREADELLAVGDTIATIDESAEAAVDSASAAAPPAGVERGSETVETAAPAADAPAVGAPEQETATPTEAPVSKAGPPRAEPPTAPSPLDDMSPAVRRLVVENDIDTSQIQGTGRGGRLIKQDVLALLKEMERDAQQEGGPVEEAKPEPAPPAASVPVTPTPEVAEPVPAAASTEAPPAASAPADPAASPPEGGIRRVPMSRIRRRIAQRLVQAQRTAAMLSTFNEVDLREIMSLRARHKERFQEKHGVSLGLMSFFSRAAVLALLDYPEVNASVDEGDIVYHDYVNLGIAVSAERGLLVPILRRADLMSMAQTEQEIKRLAAAARDNKLRLDELSGGTFTITNGGVFGSLLSTPILTPPQSGILGMHAIKERPVVVAGEVEVRPMMYLALSYDHRLVDGEKSVRFLVRMKELLEDPARLMLEI